MEIVKKLNAEQEFDHMIAFGFLSVLTSCCTFAVFFTGEFFVSFEGHKRVKECVEFFGGH